MRDIIISSLQNARLFVITENQERAAVLRGSDDDLVFTDEHAASDSVHAQANFGFGGSGVNSRTATRGSRSSYGGMNVGDSENNRKHGTKARSSRHCRSRGLTTGT